MIGDLPEALQLRILLRLPTKCLLRCRSVCKSWSLFISSSHFISSHTLNSHAVGNYNLLLRRFCCTQNREIYTLHDENDCSRITRELNFPFGKAQGNYFTIVGCSYGLICLWDDTHGLNPVTLWNPTINKSFQVPDLHYNMSNDRSIGCVKLAFGFGFDVVANDYKILRIAFCFSHDTKSKRVNRRPLSFLSKPVVCSADIFSLRTKSWRCISNSVPLQQLSIPVFLNGAFHFLTHKDGNKCAIMSLGLNAEIFREMACPQDVKVDVELDQWIAGSSESIFLLQQRPNHIYDIWMMKEYNVEGSWTKLVSIGLDKYCGLWKRILGFSRNGGLILVGDGSWVGYRVADQEVKILDLMPLGPYYAPHTECYMESLVLLGDGNSVTHLQQNHGDNMQEDHKRKGPTIHRVPGKRRGKGARMPSIPLCWY